MKEIRRGVELTYQNIYLGTFISRENRFVSYCQLPGSNQSIPVHVKNTGRCKELLIQGVEVALDYQASKTRKTDYDLVAVKKGKTWVNIDSQLPNDLAASALKTGDIQLPGLLGRITHLRREVTFGSSRFDLVAETDLGETAIIEVKGMTLEKNGLAAFPDAPTSRGLKHIKGLTKLRKSYPTYLLFIIQLEPVQLATLHKEMDPAFYEGVQLAKENGVQIVAYNCHVTPETVEIKKEIPFKLDKVF